MYTEFAGLWEQLSPRSRYREQGRRWARLLGTPGPGRQSLLVLGVGGGHLLSHIDPGFARTAVDLSASMLANSRAVNPGVRHLEGDIRTLALNEQFDAVLMLDAVSYLLTPQEVGASLACAASHLRPGGLLAVAPDYVEESFPGPHLEQYPCGPGVDVLEWCTGLQGHLLETLFLFVFRQGDQVRVEPDLHRMAVFPCSFWMEALDELGLEPRCHAPESGQAPQCSYVFVGMR